MPDQRDYSTEIMAPSEDRPREFKRSAPWNELRHKIARAALAMANKRDGGLIILGVQHDGTGCIAAGVSAGDLKTYDDDEIKGFINQYADPYVACSIHRPIVNQKQFIVIDVSEFDDVPVICKKDANDGNNKPILQSGGVYARSFRKPESCLVQSQTEMREILDMAVERGIRRFLARAEGTGASLRIEPTDTERFDEERREFDQRIDRSDRFARGHYLVSIRPSVYDAELIRPMHRILDLVDQRQVRHGGWTFPMIIRREETVEQRCAGMPGHPDGWGEYWRMYQSGHFLCAIAYREDTVDREPLDYLDERDQRMAPGGFEPKGVINIHTLIRVATHAYEFAARLATALGWDAVVEVNLTLTNVADRIIVSTDTLRPVGRFWRTTAHQIESRHAIEAMDLLAQARGLAAVAATEILERFAASEIKSVDVAAVQQGLFAD
jgi:hypothetical protein